MARYKGNLEQNVKGARALEQLKNGDTVLISEGCTHHRQCEDIGTVKLPRWIREYTGKELQFQFTSGGTFPADLSPYALIVHCGGCMLNEKEMQHRLSIAKAECKNDELRHLYRLYSWDSGKKPCAFGIIKNIKRKQTP